MSDCDLLNKGDLIKSRWRITEKIGGGGFGQIYQAYDKFRRELVAVKVESNCQARQGIRMEVTVLRRIQNRQHVCELLTGGTTTLYNYMIITLLGASLSELRRHLSEPCFSLSTTLRMSLQILEAIESVHSIGFLHRDIKPSNFAVGKDDIRQIYILDFGLARKYTDFDQQVRPARSEAGFRGTIRYASINAHNNRELGRHDDLWSFFYMLVEFLIGSLPWSKVKDKESVGRLKEAYDNTRFLTYLPDEFDQFLEHIQQLRYEDSPDYDFLRSLFTAAIERLGYRLEDPYDWESKLPLKIEQPQQRKLVPENNIQGQRSKSRSPMPNSMAREPPRTNRQRNSQSFNKVKSNGLLTFFSQAFSHAVAPGTPSLFSQWSLTSSGAERTPPNSTHFNRYAATKNNSAGRSSFVSLMDFENHDDDVDQRPRSSLPPKQQQQQFSERLTEIPFGPYVIEMQMPPKTSHQRSTKE